MQLKLWKNFSKRRNSTKQPAEADAVVEIVRLKNATSIENPVFIILGNDFEYNYAQAFGHYYYIDDIVSLNNNMCELHCSQDLLATYKTEILSTKAYINYAASNYNRKIIDNRIACLVDKTITRQALACDLFNTEGCYILTVANNTGGYSGFASQYVVQPAVLEGIAQILYSDSIIQALENQFNQPINSILNCIWIPFDYTTVLSKTQANAVPVVFGKTEATGVVARIINTAQTVIGRTYNINIPWIYDDFRRNSPYTSASLYIPYYGNIDINLSDLTDETQITVAVAVDVANGDVMISLYGATSGAFIQTLSFNTGANCPISQVTNNMTGVLSSIGGSVGGIITAGAGLAAGASAGVIAGGIGAMLIGAGSAALESNKRSTSVKGSISGRSANAYGTNLILSLFAQDTLDPDNADFIATNGRLVSKTDSLANYAGYVKTVQASVNISGLGNDKEALNSMLDAGIYIE